MTTPLGSVELYSLAHDLVGVVQQYQQHTHVNTSLQMHNTRMGERDEIRVMALDTVSGKEKLIVKISLAQLSPTVRAQLQEQISSYNETLSEPDVFAHNSYRTGLL